jgi:hypothetical protein
LAAVAVAALAACALALPAAAEARRAPVVVVNFDEFPVTSLLNRSGRIDAIRYPNFAALARGATWFSNASTEADSTKFAIPAILDGKAPRRGRPANFHGHPQNAFTLFHAHGYRVRGYEEATSLCPYRACRRHHKARYFLVRRREGRFIDFVRSIHPTKRPGFYYKHTLLPHVPWILLPSARQYSHGVIGPIPGLNSGALSSHDPFLVRQSWQRHLLQVGAVDRLLGALVGRLKATGLYDQALIVVLADHGIAFRNGAPDRRTVTHRNIQDIMPIPLFVKAPRQRRGRTSGAFVRTSDVLPTIADILNIRVPWPHRGRSGFSRALRRRGPLRILSRSPKPVLTISRRHLLQRKRRSLRRRIRLLGAGHHSMFAIGRYSGLVGRPESSLRIATGGRVRAKVADAGELRHVDFRSGFVPVFLAGRIRGGRRGARRYVAVAVNGRIRGVGRSFYLRGQRTETFSLFISELALLQGRNNLEVLSVRRVRKKLRFRRIYGRPATTTTTAGPGA